jgi:hypothetical protein
MTRPSLLTRLPREIATSRRAEKRAIAVSAAESRRRRRRGSKIQISPVLGYLGRPIKVVVGNYNEATLHPHRQAKFRRFPLFRLTRGSLEIIEWKRFARHWHAPARLSSRRGNRMAMERKGAIRVESDEGKISSPIFPPRYLRAVQRASAHRLASHFILCFSRLENGDTLHRFSVACN